ncbi:LysM peptidoglycan-binding domain-containing protein [Pediococcus pentosaceus]
MNKKRITSAALATALLFAPLAIQTSTAMADSFYTQQTNAERADITNWVANTTEDISNNINAQHIDTNNLHGNKYVIQWGDTLSGISDATGISMAKLAYDNNIQNIDLIYAGDTLVLNRDGEVPSDWHYYGDGVYVAKTKVTINNFVDNSHNTVNINVSPISHEEGSSSSKSKDDSNEYISDLDPDGKKGEAASDTDSSSDSKSSSKNHHSDSSDSKSDSDEMDESDFSDAVSNEVSSKLGLNDGKLTVDFTGKDDDSDSDADTDDTSDDSDSDTEDVYDSDQDVSTGSDKLTDENAEKLADKIVAQLKADGKTKDIDDADDVELTIEANDDDFSFNVTLTTTDDSDSDEDSNSDDSDADTDSEGADSEDTDTDSEDVDSSSDESSDEDTDFDDESEDADTDTEDEDQNSSSEDEDSNNQVTTNDDENTDTEE